MQIALFGDILIQGRMAEDVAEDGGDQLVARLRQLIGPADVVVGNLETFVCPPGCPPANEWFSPPEAVDIIRRAGFAAVSVAANHAWDHGQAAIEHTLALLQSAGIAAYGLGDALGNPPQPVILERHGVRIGLQGYGTASTVIGRRAYTAAAPSAKRIAGDLAELRKRCDVLIVSIHHGDHLHPSPELRSWARMAMEAGAAAVVVHHSHEISGVEQIGNGVAAYGLANVVAPFTQERYRTGLCLRLNVEGGRVAAWRDELFFIDERGYPCQGSAAQQGQFRELINQVNRDLARGDYESCFWSRFAAEQQARYLRSWRRDLRTYGLRTVYDKLRHLRMHQLKVLWHVLFSKKR